jgi:hypothetical protein
MYIIEGRQSFQFICSFVWGVSGSRIHEHTISTFHNFIGLLGIILRVLRVEVSIYNVYITNKFKPLLLKGRLGVKTFCRSDCEYSKEENS